MLIPIRCFTCNNILADKDEKYKELIKNKIEFLEIFKILKIKNYCCRTILKSYVEI